MNRIFLTIIGLTFCSSISLAQPINPNQSQRKIQVAILFDTSNSMDGLIDQAKAKIWSIVNDLSSLKHQGQNPTIEIALYDYGNSGLSAESNYIRKQIDLTTDLDVISEKLFGLRTNGGSEYCGAVIGASIDELKWTSHPQDLRMIYIAGNEPFNQGKIDYKEVCKTAAQKDINVNTIYCGNYDQGVREFWYDGAKLGKGEYFNIDSDQQIVHINSPYDDQINAYNDSLNKTYYGYGSMGATGKMNQSAQDMNAVSESVSTKAERAIVKTKSSYVNPSWDLIDAVEEGNKELSAIPEADLPDEFKGKTEEEKKKLIEEKKMERELFQKKIGELAVERQKFIDEERKKNPVEGESDFGSSVQKSILKRASELGYEKE
jgi:hypothetical protein